MFDQPVACPRMSIDQQVLDRHGLTRRGIRPHRRRAEARADRDRARHLLGDVVGALQLQELAHSSEEAADPGAARAAGSWRERRRGGHRRRPGRGLQDRVAQPSVVHRALPGGGDRRRRHHPRHLHDGRASDRAVELAAVRQPRRTSRRPHAADRRRRRLGYRRLRQQHRDSDRRRRGCLRRCVRRQSAGERAVPGHRRGRRAGQGHAPRASATPSTTSAQRPAATASTARRWRRRSSTRSRPRSARPCRSATRSWRSCCSRPASS